MAKRNGVLTTGQAAKFCNVAARTVSKWFDCGLLPGYRIPGSKDRRIPMEQLIRFMREHGLPMNGVATERPCVLVLDADPEFETWLRANSGAESRRTSGFEMIWASSLFEAGIAMSRHDPQVVVVHVDFPHLDAERFCQELRGKEAFRNIKLIALSREITGDERIGLIRAGFDSVVRKPADPNELIDLVCEALELPV